MWQWSAVALTCRYSPDDLAAAYHHELKLWQKKGIISPNTEIIVVEDPGPELGSGGATLNAILVIAEQLSVSNGFSVLVADVVRDARILIIHVGRQHHSTPCGSSAFLQLPECAGVISPSDCRVPLTPLLHTYLIVTSLAERSQRGNGLWVCGADSFLVLDNSTDALIPLTSDQSDILIFSIPVEPSYVAEKHGAYKLDKQNSPEEIIYRGTLDQVQSCRISEKDQRVPLVVALSHLKSSVAESLLHLQNRGPLNRCTYLGVDNGALSLQLSFFFDFLAATCSGATEDSFVHGKTCTFGGTGDKRQDSDELLSARRLIWQTFRGYKSSVFLLPSLYYHYFLDDPRDLQEFMMEVSPILNGLGRPYVTSPVEQKRIGTGNGDGRISGTHGITAAFANQRSQTLQVHLGIVGDVLRNNRHECLLPIFLNCVIDGFALDLLKYLDEIAVGCDSTSVIGRTLSCIADVLGFWAKGHGGLRSGPAQNAEWLDALQLLEEGNIEMGIQRMSELRCRWSTRPDRLIRAARHYEAAAQIFVRRTVMDSVKEYIQSVRPMQAELTNVQETVWHRAVACARIDVAGGWSDTPPITYENGGAVLDIAIQIDGKKPIGAKCRRIAEPVIVLIAEHYGVVESRLVIKTMDDIMCYKRPGAPGSLVCATIVCTGLIHPNDNNDTRPLHERLLDKWGGGLEITYWSDLPHGSGLGASSILAGCVVATIWKAVGIEVNVECIMNAVLYVEQLMTTGGGWQDQVGGLCPGVKIGRFECDATWKTSSGRPRLTVEQVNMTEDQLEWLNSHLLLVYTGKTRLAKNLLQEVVRSWYARKQDIVNTVMALVENAEKTKEAFQKGDWSTVAGCAGRYWEQKKLMVGGSGCEPERVTRLLKKLYDRELIDAGWLAGAGGGGFLYLITKQANCKQTIQNALMEDKEIGGEMSAHTVKVDLEPFTMDMVYGNELTGRTGRDTH